MLIHNCKIVEIFVLVLVINCYFQALARHPRLLTVLETFTLSENFTTTITTTNLKLQTLYFTTDAAVAPRACYPLDFLENNLIEPCADIG